MLVFLLVKDTFTAMLLSLLKTHSISCFGTFRLKDVQENSIKMMTNLGISRMITNGVLMETILAD